MAAWPASSAPTISSSVTSFAPASTITIGVGAAGDDQVERLALRCS
jgi:hypothetical protein